MSPHAFVLNRFGKDRRGTTAIEFAILAPVFLILMLAIVDFGLLYQSNSHIERSVFLAQKKLSEGWKPEEYSAVKDMICKEAGISCEADGFKVEVVPLTSTSPQPSATIADKLVLAPGQAHVIRVNYPWSGVFPKNLFSTVGLEELLTRSINVGVFFHVKG